MVSPESIIHAALLTQIFVLGIVFVGAVLLKQNETPGYLPIDQPITTSIFVLTLGNAIISLLLLCLSNAYSTLWMPLAREMSFTGIRWQTSLLAVWVIDIFFVSYVAKKTGGSRSSPFAALFFVFPTIALFLHEPGWRLFLYTGLVVVLFSLANIFPDEGEQQERISDQMNQLCFWFVSVAAFILTTTIGFVTRE